MHEYIGPFGSIWWPFGDLDTSNIPVILIEQVDSKRQRTSDITDHQGPQNIVSVQMDTAFSSNGCNLDKRNSQNNRKELLEKKTMLEEDIL